MFSSALKKICPKAVAVLGVLVLVTAASAGASSHREAPLITEMPKVDGTDFYAFRSYEPGRDGFVTLIANYQPVQVPGGGPNYYTLDEDAFYDIHVDNTGDGVEDLTFRFKFGTFYRDFALPVNGAPIAVPLINIGPVRRGVGRNELNRLQSYTVRVVRGPVAEMDDGAEFLSRRGGGALPNRFVKPEDNIGRKTFPDYAGYARQFLYDVTIPDCGPGRVFVGQRDDPFVVNLGEVFDLVNLDPLGPPDGATDYLKGLSVTSIALEVPIDCLTGDGPVVGAWTTASLPRVRQLLDAPTLETPTVEDGGYVQVSRLGNPLVNEVVIGLPDKNLFNTSRPDGDAALAAYVTNPTLPELLQVLFGVTAPNNFPRNDLVAAFVTGIEGLNAFGFGEFQRLNTSIPPTPRAAQDRLGVIAGDAAGFPNGRRPGDDVTDIALRVAMGKLCHLGLGLCEPADAPSGDLPYTDGALVEATDFADAFPYVLPPVPGSPSGAE